MARWVAVLWDVVPWGSGRPGAPPFVCGSRVAHVVVCSNPHDDGVRYERIWAPGLEAPTRPTGDPIKSNQAAAPHPTAFESPAAGPGRSPCPLESEKVPRDTPTTPGQTNLKVVPLHPSVHDGGDAAGAGPRLRRVKRRTRCRPRRPTPSRFGRPHASLPTVHGARCPCHTPRHTGRARPNAAFKPRQADDDAKARAAARTRTPAAALKPLPPGAFGRVRLNSWRVRSMCTLGPAAAATMARTQWGYARKMSKRKKRRRPARPQLDF